MAEEWGYFINIENNKALTPPMQSLINYRDEDDEYNFNKYNYKNSSFEYHYISNKNRNAKTDSESNSESEIDKYNNRFNKNNRIFALAYILFNICNFGVYILNSCKSIASFVSFTNNNPNANNSK
jgi:hypothetical protein